MTGKEGPKLSGFAKRDTCVNPSPTGNKTIGKHIITHDSLKAPEDITKNSVDIVTTLKA